MCIFSVLWGLFHYYYQKLNELCSHNKTQAQNADTVYLEFSMRIFSLVLIAFANLELEVYLLMIHSLYNL